MPRWPEDEKREPAVLAAVMGFKKIQEKLWEDDIVVLSLTVRLPQEEGDEYLLIVRAERVDEKLVAFQNSDYFWQVWLSFAKAVQYGKLRFKEDQYG